MSETTCQKQCQKSTMGNNAVAGGFWIKICGQFTEDFSILTSVSRANKDPPCDLLHSPDSYLQYPSCDCWVQVELLEFGGSRSTQNLKHFCQKNSLDSLTNHTNQYQKTSRPGCNIQYNIHSYKTLNMLWKGRSVCGHAHCVSRRYEYLHKSTR